VARAVKPDVIRMAPDYDVALRDADLDLIDLSDQGGQADEHIGTDTLPPGRYFVQVYHYGSGGSMAPYHLEVGY